MASAPTTSQLVSHGASARNDAETVLGVASRPSRGESLVLAGERADAVVQFEKEVVAFFVEAADLLAVPKSVAAIYGICFASPEPLSFAEIDTRLDISSGSISQGLRVLREVGALTVVSSPSERRDRFEPDLGLRKAVSHFIERRLDPQLDSGRLKLDALSKSISGNESSAKVLKARMKALQAWHERARAVLPLVKTFLKLT